MAIVSKHATYFMFNIILIILLIRSSYLTIVLPVQQLGNIPILWIILAVLFGILLIALISIIMYRTGCFTRSPVGDEDVDIPYHAGSILDLKFRTGPNMVRSMSHRL